MATALPCFKGNMLILLFLRLRRVLLLSLLFTFIQPCVVASIIPRHEEFLETFVLYYCDWLVRLYSGQRQQGTCQNPGQSVSEKQGHLEIATV